MDMIGISLACSTRTYELEFFLLSPVLALRAELNPENGLFKPLGVPPLGACFPDDTNGRKLLRERNEDKPEGGGERMGSTPATTAEGGVD